MSCSYVSNHDFAWILLKLLSFGLLLALVINVYLYKFYSRGIPAVFYAIGGLSIIQFILSFSDLNFNRWVGLIVFLYELITVLSRVLPILIGMGWCITQENIKLLLSSKKDMIIVAVFAASNLFVMILFPAILSEKPWNNEVCQNLQYIIISSVLVVATLGILHWRVNIIIGPLNKKVSSNTSSNYNPIPQRTTPASLSLVSNDNSGEEIEREREIEIDVDEILSERIREEEKNREIRDKLYQFKFFYSVYSFILIAMWASLGYNKIIDFYGHLVLVGFICAMFRFQGPQAQMFNPLSYFQR